MITRRKVLGAAALTGVALATGSARAIASSGSIADELAAFVRNRADRGLFSGAVRLDYLGCPVYSAAYGLADRDAGIPNTTDTRFTIASVGKFFTGVTAGRFVQDGRLTFGTTFGEAVPQLRNPALRGLTLHQLLTHTAALPEMPPGPPEGVPVTGRAIDYLPMLERLQLVGTPGERWSYSNAGFIAAGLMIEQAGRRPYRSAVRDSVFHPARMRRTVALGPEPGPPVAVRYTPDGTSFPADYATGAGGFYSTVGDLVAFANALIRRRLLDDAHTTEVITGKVPTGHGDLYAYGCSVLTANGHPIIWHNGGAPGANAWLQIYPDDGYTLAALSNVWDLGTPTGVQPIVDKAQRLIVAPGAP
jgi:CubicO group peptidase (beta-lactamase class C family)